MKKSEINILIVEDDSSLRQSLTEFVKKLGYKVTATGKVEEALNFVKIKPFHAAIIDCMLPRTNGVELSVQLRKSRFGRAAIILMSGVFKDKNFSADAVEKTGAVEFLKKPFDLSDLKAALENAVGDLTKSEQIPLQVLISKPFSNVRERTKVIEALEEVKGYDLPFVMSVIMDSGASGHLNMANAAGEVYGVSFSQGLITKVDSSESIVNLSLMLIDKGLISREDLASLGSSARRGDLIKALVQEQLLSPHVLPQLKKDQILENLRYLFVDETMKINFVPDRVKDRDAEISILDLNSLFVEICGETVPLEYLKSFYAEWMEFPIQLGPSFSPDHLALKSPPIQRLSGIVELIQRQLTIQEMQKEGGYNLEDLLRGFHLLILHRIIMLDDVKKVAGEVVNHERIRNILKDLKNKNAKEIFAYFGASPEARDIEVRNIYKEFSRSNHPDLISLNATEDIKQAINRLFSIVSDAHDTLVNPEKREEFENALKQREAERQIHAEGLADEGVLLLRRGRAAEASSKTLEAMSLYPSRNVKVAHAWALLKAYPDSAEKVGEAAKILDSIAHEERRNAQYAFVMGLLKKGLRDFKGAAAQFEKAMAMDPEFLDARREKGALGAVNEKLDLLNADLTQVVAHFFKKRR